MNINATEKKKREVSGALVLFRTLEVKYLIQKFNLPKT